MFLHGFKDNKFTAETQRRRAGRHVSLCLCVSAVKKSLRPSLKTQIRNDRKMITDLLLDPYKLLSLKSFIGENIIDPQRRGNRIKSATDTRSFFCKAVFHAATDQIIGITAGHIVEVSADKIGIRAFIHRFPDPFALDLSLEEALFQL